MLGALDRIQRLKRRAEKYAGGGGTLPPYPGSVAETYRLLYPKYLPAPHLTRIFDAYERAKREPVRVCYSYPPRAGKTEGIIAAKVDRLMLDPEVRLSYISYAAKFAEKKSARIRTLARHAGVPIDPTTRSKKDWATGYNEGGLWATSVGGQVTGMGFELMTLDDLLSGREEAESALARDRAWDFLKADAGTRLEPYGSTILCGTRWHEDDPIGRAVSEGWEWINVPALDDAGNSYWAQRWTTKRLLEIQHDLGGPDGYDWVSLYMGQPRSQGERIFQDAQFVDELPPGPCRVGIAVDFAYSTKKSADYSCAVVLAEIAGCYYVIDVLRGRWPEAEFRGKVSELAELYQAQFVVGYVAATEQANVTLLQRDGLPAYAARATQDKKVHALPAAAAWNIGRIKVLRGKAWERVFIREVQGFTGSDTHDDLVDALATGYNALWSAAPIDWDFVNAVQAAAPKAFSLTGCN